MPVWAIAAVSRRPEVTLTDWAAYEVPLNGPDEPWTLHLVGFACEDRQGQVSSPVQVFDPSTGQCITRSGRVYLVRGRPGLTADAEYVWHIWLSRSQVKDHRDITFDLDDAINLACGKPTRARKK